MVAVKILCGCGQKYAFDVDPLDGRMPSPVQCPVCRMDGTAAANEMIAQMLGIDALQPVPAYYFPPASNLTRVPDDKVSKPKWWRRLLTAWSGPRLPAPTGNDQTDSDGLWRQRALDAERRAEQAQAEARASLTPHLTQVIKDALVQELAVQRKELIQAQQIAAADLAQLTNQLDELHAPLQERLRAYEQRIQDLEKELAAKTEENRQLLKFKIELMRHQLEIEIPHNRMTFN